VGAIAGVKVKSPTRKPGVMGHPNSHQELSSGPPADFDVQVQASAPQQTVEDGRKNGGKYLVKIDKTVHGTINGGGPELQFTNFNGGIYIRKAGAAR
jgi:hypothetical protein